MNKRNTQYLFKKYSWTAPKQDLRSNLMCFGFSFRNGWYRLVKKLCEDIQVELDKHGGEEWVKRFELVQAKEKFGGLRFYIWAAPKEVHDLISEAEQQSYKICEVCGEKGKVRHLSWIQTLCEKHYVEETRIGR